MKHRYLALTLLTAVWLIAVAAIAKKAVDRLEVQPWGNPMSDSISAPLAKDTRVGQLFTAPLPGLYHIEVSLVPAAGDTTRPIIFHLKAGPDAGEDLYTAEFAPAQIKAGVPFGFEFEPIRDSKDQQFFFYLESPQSVPAGAGAASVRYSPTASLDRASAYLNGQPVAGNLTFHSFYTLRTRDRVDLLLSRMAKGRPYLMGSKAFYVILAAAYVLVLGAFLYKVGTSIVKGSEGL